MLEKGCEIDGVGIQAHYDITSFDAEMLEYLIVEIAERGLEVQITEIDFSMYDYNGDVGLYYHEFTEDMAASPAVLIVLAGVAGFLLYGRKKGGEDK